MRSKKYNSEKRRAFFQLIYYVEIYEGTRFDSSQFFDRLSSVYDFGRAEISKLDDPRVYVTKYQIRYGSNGRFVLVKLDRRTIFL